MEVDTIDLVAGLVLFISGIAIGGFAIMELEGVNERRQTYDKTEGTITKSSLVSFNIDHDNATEHRAIIRYEYTVDGKTYQGTKIQLNGELNDYTENKQTAQQQVDKYEVGDSVRVSYATGNPSDSFLVHSQTKFVGIVISTLLALFLTISGINTVRIAFDAEERPQRTKSERL